MKTAVAAAFLLLATAALGLSGYLWFASASGGGVAGCTWSAFDCDAVLSSRWGKWLGLPVAAGGVACYGLAIVGGALTLAGGRVASIGWRMLELACPLAVGAGAWFVAVQSTALDSFCLYCVLTHLSGLLMTAAAFAWRRLALADEDGTAPPLGLAATIAGDHLPAPTPSATAAPPALGVATVAGVLGVVALVGGQLAGPAERAVVQKAELSEDFRLDPAPADAAAPALADEPLPWELPDAAEPANIETSASDDDDMPPRRPTPRVGSRTVSLLGDRLRFDAYRQALLGSPDAKHVVVEMMDYACPHCREFHDTLEAAVERFAGELAVVIMPVPGEILCNKYVRKARSQSAGACFAAKLSMAVAELSPDRFARFHHWMLEAESIPTRTASLLQAQRHAPHEELSATLEDATGDLAKRVKRHVELAASLQRMGKFGLPTLLVGNNVISGPPNDLDELSELLDEQLAAGSP